MRVAKCKNCGEEGHYASFCWKAKKEPIKVRKPIKKVGKVTRKWLKTHKEWLRQNPPDNQGNYICSICAKPVNINEVSLDHILPRSTHPELRYEFSNLQPAHYLCNYKKGSVHERVPRLA